MLLLSADDDHISYPGAGHTFFAYSGVPGSNHPKGRPHPITGRPLTLGGSHQANALAGRQAWQALVTFLTALGCP